LQQILSRIPFSLSGNQRTFKIKIFFPMKQKSMPGNIEVV